MKHTKLKKILASLTLIILLNLQGGVLIANAEPPPDPKGNTPTDTSGEASTKCIDNKTAAAKATQDSCVETANTSYTASQNQCNDTKESGNLDCTETETEDKQKCSQNHQSGTSQLASCLSQASQKKTTCFNEVVSSYNICLENATSAYNDAIGPCQTPYQQAITEADTVCKQEAEDEKNNRGLINPDFQPSNLPSLPSVIDANTREEKVQLPINVFLQQIAGALLSISGALAVVIFAIGGVMYATSHGNQQQMEMAKNTIVYGVIGSLAIIFSYLIIRIVLQVIFGLA